MKNEYKTKDLAEAGALVTKNQQLIRIEREGKTCWFIFANADDCEKLSNIYFFGELLINARTFYESMLRLKNRIFSS